MLNFNRYIEINYINQLYYKDALDPTHGTKQSPAIQPVWRHPYQTDQFIAEEDEPYLTLSYVSKKQLTPRKPLLCVHDCGFFDLFYWMMEVFAPYVFPPPSFFVIHNILTKILLNIGTNLVNFGRI